MVLHLGAEAGPELALGDGHADGVAQALPQRSGGDLHPGGVASLRMSRRRRAPLPERTKVVELQAESAQEQQRVLQDRRVAVGEDEPVAVGPVGLGRVEAHDPAEQHVTERRQGHGRALVTGLRGQRRVHGQAPDHVDGLLIELT